MYTGQAFSNSLRPSWATNDCESPWASQKTLSPMEAARGQPTCFLVPPIYYMSLLLLSLL